MSQKIAVRQFAIVDHEPIDRGPNAGVFHTRGDGDERIELFILAEGTTPAGHEFAGHVVTAIGHVWQKLDLSLTGCLRAAFAEAARNVGDWNEKSLAKQSVALGLTCVARRGDQMIIGMAGPSVAYHISQGGLRAFHPYDESAAPIDGATELEPTMERVDLTVGDNVLLLTAEAAVSLEPRALAGVMQFEPEDILRELFVRVRELGQVTAVLLTPEGAAAATPIEENKTVEIGAGAPVIGGAAGRQRNNQPSLFVDGGAQEQTLERARQQLTRPNLTLYVSEPPAQETVAAAPLRRVSGDETLARLASDHQARASVAASIRTTAASSGGPRREDRPSRPAPDPSSASSRFQSSQTAAPMASARDRRNRSFSRTLSREAAQASRPAPPAHARPVSEMASEQRANADVYRRPEALQAGPLASNGISGSIQEPLVRMRGDMGGRWKSGGNIGGGIGLSMPPTWFVAFGGIAIFLVLIGFLVIPGLLEEESAQQQAALLDEAQQQLQVARVQENATDRRDALNQAHATALEALAYDADSSMAQTIVNEVAGAIQQLDAVTSPASVEPIGSLEQFGDSPVAATRMVIGEREAYILDGESGGVIAIDLATGEPDLIYVSSEESARPIALAYAEVAGFGGATLLIMDSAGNLWRYSAGGELLDVEIARPETFTPTDIAFFEQQLYVLDASSGVVLRFAPGGDGFDTLPSVALESVEFQTARRLMTDEEIITANVGGEVWRYSGALPLHMSQAGIDTPLVAAESPQPFGVGGQIAMLDAANDRIIVLERNGSFLQQYQHDDFQGITAFAMRAGVGYVYSGGWLRRVTF